MHISSIISLVLAASPLLVNSAALGRRHHGKEEEEYAWDTAGLKEQGLCRNYRGLDLHDLSLSTCECGPDARSVTCIGLQGVGVGDSYSTDYLGREYNLGQCQCNMPEMDLLADIVAEILPALGHATCLALMKAAQTTFELGLTAVPLAKGASMGMRLGVMGAKTLAKQPKGEDGMSIWLSPCGDVPPNMKRAFNDAFKVWKDTPDPDNVADDWQCAKFACEPVEDEGYSPGQCKLHIVQHQKPDPSKDQYKFDVTVKDSSDKEIGSVQGVEGLQGKHFDVSSHLPYEVLVEAGGVDEDAVLLKYAGDHWDTNNEQRCTMGSYGDMKREGDCSFKC